MGDGRTDGMTGKHRLKETAPGGGQHRADGEAADPIEVKREPGKNLAKPLVREKAAELYENRTKGIR
jgi:hypothetical protein